MQEYLEEDYLKLYNRSVELERELMKAGRYEKALTELEERYAGLMDSLAFFYFLVSPEGNFMLLNYSAEKFWELTSAQAIQSNLSSFLQPNCTEELKHILQQAALQTIIAEIETVRSDGKLRQLLAEFSPSTYQGSPAVQVIALDISDLTNETPAPRQEVFKSGTAVLNCCPGLLCAAVDVNGLLLHATQGYQEVARRCMGAVCKSGEPHPKSFDTVFSKKLRGMISEAFTGNTSRIDLIEKTSEDKNRGWGVTVSPLRDENEIAGAVIYMTPLPPDEVEQEEKPKVAELPKKTTDLPLKAGHENIISFDSLPYMALLLDSQTKCIDANIHFLARIKAERQDVKDKKFTELLAFGDLMNEGFFDRYTAFIASKDNAGLLECRVCAKDGELVSLKMHPQKLEWDKKEAILLLCEDNTELLRTKEQLKRMASTDRTTGIMNRSAMEDIISSQIEKLAHTQGALSLIFADIDSFRALNERLGYATSDRALKNITALLKDNINESGFFGRWGGDEFIILTELPFAEVCHMAESLRDKVQYNTFGDSAPITLSFGVAEFEKGMDITSFIAAAYDSMVLAKKSGGNTVKSNRTEQITN